MANKKESTVKTFLTVFVLCLICSIFVAGVTVSLKKKKKKAKALDKQSNIVLVSGLKYDADKDDVAEIFKNHIETKILDLQTGEFLPEGKIKDPENFDYVSASKKAEYRVDIDKSIYKLGIASRSKYMPVYVARDDQKNIVSYILPIYGQGLWSTLYGMLSVTSKGNEIVGINFYEHGETPGLGGEISNPLWTAKWKGKHVYLNDKIVRVVKGSAADGEEGTVQVDGISGATLTGTGVTNSLAYWLSKNGYKPFLDKLIGE